MAGITDRFRGQVVLGSVLSNQIKELSSSPIVAPTISFDGARSTGTGASQFVFTVTMNRAAFGDTNGEAISRRASMNYHFEDTAGGLLDGATFALAAAGAQSTADTAVGLVIPNSTVAGGYHVGRLLSSTAGVVNASFTATTGSSAAGVFFVTLPNGLVATSSQVAFST